MGSFSQRQKPLKIGVIDAGTSVAEGVVMKLGLVSLSFFFLAGCGCDPGNNSVRAPIDFTPSSVDAVRTPATCNAGPTFDTNDTLTLELLGPTNVPPPYTLLKLTVPSNVALNVAKPLMVGVDATSARSMDGSVSFSLQNGASLDDSPLASVIVTVSQVPLADGEELTAELHLTFEDGRVLDQSYGAPVESIVVACK